MLYSLMKCYNFMNIVRYCPTKSEGISDNELRMLITDERSAKLSRNVNAFILTNVCVCQNETHSICRHMTS